MNVIMALNGNAKKKGLAKSEDSKLYITHKMLTVNLCTKHP